MGVGVGVRRGFPEEVMLKRGEKCFLAERTAGAEARRPQEERCLHQIRGNPHSLGRSPQIPGVERSTVPAVGGPEA